MTKRLSKILVTALMSLCLVFAALALVFTGVHTPTNAEEGEQVPAAEATYHIGAEADDTDNNVYKTQSAGWMAAVAKAKEVYDGGGVR